MDEPGQPLPKNFIHDSKLIVDAHNKCLEIESVLSNSFQSQAPASTKGVLRMQLMSIRLLGHLLTFSPSDAGKEYLARTILGCKTDPELFDIGKVFQHHFIRSFWRRNGTAPVPNENELSEDESSEDESIWDHSWSQWSHVFASMEELREATLVLSPTNTEEAKRAALARDEFRCVASGRLDYRTLSLVRDLKPKGPVDVTECCYICPDLTDANIGTDHEDSVGIASIVLRSLDFAEATHELTGNHVHSLQNILTLTPACHDFFSTLQLRFEDTNVLNRYLIDTEPSILKTALQISPFVEFETSQPILDLPSAKYLKVHAACCRVAHMSGTAQYLEDLDAHMRIAGFEPSDTDAFAST